jgi:hypothetical protein
MVAFVGSTIVAAILAYAIVWYSKRRPVGTPVTWGEAMFAATYVFFLMFWVYGVVPHSWLTWADTQLKWRSDAYILGPNSTSHLPILQNLPMNISKQAVRDLIAVGIYGVFLVMHVRLFSMWQGRGDVAAQKQKAIEEQTTSFGRPLVRNP